MKIRSIKFNFAMNMIRTLMSILFPLITFPYVSRILLVGGIGKASYVVSIVSYFQLLASLGISTYAITEGAKIRDNREKLSHFATEILIINLISTIISYLLFFVILILPIFRHYRQLLLISSISIIFTTIGIDWIYSIIEEYQYITIRSVAFQFLSLILLFIFVRGKNDIAQYVALTAISAAGSGIFNFMHARKYIGLFSDPLKTYNLQQHLRPIFVIFGMSIASTIYLNADTTMIGIMKGDVAVGIYISAVKINRIVVTLISSLSVVLLSRLSYYIGADDKLKFNALVEKTIQFMLIFIVPCMIGMFLMSREIILIISGPSFIGAVLTERIMIFNLFLSPINAFLAFQVFMPFRKEKVALYATVSGAIINMLLNFLLIPKYSYQGAAFATIIAEGIVMLVCSTYANKLINIKEIMKGSWQYVVASIPIILVYYIVGWCLVTNIFLRTILITSFSVIIYGLGLFAMKNQILIDILDRVKAKKVRN